MNPLYIGIAALLFLTFASKPAAASVSKAILSKGYPTGAAWSKWDSLFKKYGEQYKVPWSWLKAICMTESALGTAKSVMAGLKNPSDPLSISTDGLSWGLMQIRVETANDMEKGTTWVKLNDPETAVRIAAKFLRWLINQFPEKKGNELTKAVIMSYNQGAGNTKKGKTYAAPYWEKFNTNIQIMRDRGDVL